MTCRPCCARWRFGPIPTSPVDPDEMPVRTAIKLADGRTIIGEKSDTSGFHTKPMSWDRIQAKFDRLTHGIVDPALAHEISAAVEGLEAIAVRQLTGLLGRV